MDKQLRLACLWIFVFAISSCADVSVRKIPTSTQYDKWTDEDQRKADAIEGFRFYLPRPFVNVFESFPVHSEVYIANGTVSPDGRYIIIRKVRSDSPLSNYFASALMGLEVPASVVLPSRAGRDVPPRGQSDESTIDPTTTDETSAKAATTGDREREAGPVESGVQDPQVPTFSSVGGAQPPAPAEKTGVDKRGVTNDNSAFAYQPMRGNMDIVYMPDFDEQYAVSSETGLGSAEFELNLGQGWSLQGFNSTVDNSALNGRILELIDKASTLATGTIEGALTGVPGASTLLENIAEQQKNNIAKAQVGKSSGDAVAGADVSIKINVVYYAAKGLYPVIKPRELKRLKSTQVSAEDSGKVILDITGAMKGSIKAAAVTPAALRAAKAAIEAPGGFTTKPRYPYMYLSFNTFRIMAVEAIDPTGNPFGRLPDKTGTSGSPGDLRMGPDDRAPITNRPGPGPNPDDDNKKTSGPTVQSNSIARLQGELIGLGASSVPITFKGHNNGATYTVVGFRPLAAPAAGKSLDALDLCVKVEGQSETGLASNTEQAAFFRDLRNAVKDRFDILLKDLDFKKIRLVKGQTEAECFPKKRTPPPAVPLAHDPSFPVVAQVKWRELPATQRKLIQKAVCSTEDGVWGPNTYRAIIDWGVHKRGQAIDGRLMDDAVVTELVEFASHNAERTAYCAQRAVLAREDAPQPSAAVAAKFKDVKLVDLNGATISVTSAAFANGRIALELKVETKAKKEVVELSLKTNLISAAGLPYGFRQANLVITNLSDIKDELGSP